MLVTNTLSSHNWGKCTVVGGNRQAKDSASAITAINNLQLTWGFSVQLFLYIKFYWHTATVIHLHIICGCSSAIATELGNYDRYHLAHKAYNI